MKKPWYKLFMPSNTTGVNVPPSSIEGVLTHVPKSAPVISVDDLTNSILGYSGQNRQDHAQHSIFDGGKFSGGFGPTQVYELDYWTLRARSAQLFNENLYARRMIRRLITNSINTGLTPEAMPDEEILGMTEEALNDI